jgi:hypothetical protein
VRYCCVRYVCTVPAVALIQGVRTSTPVTFTSGFMGELGARGSVPEREPWRLSLLLNLMGYRVDDCIPS